MTQATKMPEYMRTRLEGSADRPGEIELRPDEAVPFALFTALGTQWNRHPMTGERLGLNYGVIPETASMMGVAMTPAVFADLQIMEGAALEELARGARR